MQEQLREKKVLLVHNPRTGEKTYAILRFLPLGTELIGFEHVPSR